MALDCKKVMYLAMEFTLFSSVNGDLDPMTSLIMVICSATDCNAATEKPSGNWLET